MSAPCPPPEGKVDPQVDVRRVAASDIGADGTWPMPPGSGPCRTWPLEPGCGCLAPGTVRQGDTTSPWDGARAWTQDQRYAVELATEILWRLTAGKYGLCMETVRPCRRCTCDMCGGGTPRHGGAWLPLQCARCGPTSRCGCNDPSELLLPSPVYWEPLSRPPDWRQSYRPADRPPDLEVDDRLSSRYRLIVWVDGTPLKEPGWPLEWEPGQPLPETYTPARGDYWLYGVDRLVRLNGLSWPSCQDLSRPLQAREEYPDEAAGTFGVQYWRGTPVPPGGRRAVALLACELWKACQQDSSCRLPQHVQSITREGVQYQMVDTTDYLAEGRIGLPDVDMWVSAVNPRKQRSQSLVISPDLPMTWSEWSTGGRD